MTRLSVQPVRDRSELRRFLDVEWQVRKDDPAWVPQLRSDVAARLKLRRNPFWRRAEGALFLARRGSDLVGRILVAADTLARRKAAFGFFECVPGDVEAARALIDAAGQVAADEGTVSMVGPFALPAFPEEAGLPAGDRDEMLLSACGFEPRETLRWERRELGGGDPEAVTPGPEVGEIAKAVVAAAPRLQGALGWEVTEGEAAAKLARLRPVLDPDLAVVGPEDVAVAVPDMTPVRRAVVRGAGPVETARLAAAVRRDKVGAVVSFLTEPALLGALEARAAAGGYRRLGSEDETMRLLWARHL